MKQREFWRERSSGRLYAIELEDGLVSRSCGPLTVSETDDRFLPTFDYTPERASWLEKHRDAFDLFRQTPQPVLVAASVAGRLERVRVAEAMHSGVITCAASSSLGEVARLMASAHIHAVVVWGDEEDDSEGIWAIVSDLDLVAAVARGGIGARSAIGAAGTPVVTVTRSATLQTAAELMERNRVTHLVVLADDRIRPVGILSTLDIARAIAGTR